MSKSYKKLLNDRNIRGVQYCVATDREHSHEDQQGGIQKPEGPGPPVASVSGALPWSNHVVYPGHSSPPHRPTWPLRNVSMGPQSRQVRPQAFSRCGHKPCQLARGLWLSGSHHKAPQKFLQRVPQHMMDTGLLKKSESS